MEILVRLTPSLKMCEPIDLIQFQPALRCLAISATSCDHTVGRGKRIYEGDVGIEMSLVCTRMRFETTGQRLSTVTKTLYSAPLVS